MLAAVPDPTAGAALACVPGVAPVPGDAGPDELVARWHAVPEAPGPVDPGPEDPGPEDPGPLIVGPVVVCTPSSGGGLKAALTRALIALRSMMLTSCKPG